MLFICVVLLCCLASPSRSHISPFNDARIKDPTTGTGPPLSASEFELARKLPPRLPSPSDPPPPMDRSPHFRNYLSYTFTRWPNGRVPYTIDESFDQQQRIVIAQAIQHVEESACVRFHPKTGSDQDFMHIFGDEKESCWADDHYQRKKGQHSVHLHREYCVYKNVVAHEILHLLGVGHEQQRPDRDLYIAVNWTNIHADHVFNFFKDVWDTGNISSIPSSTCPNWREMAAASPGNRASKERFAHCTSGLARKDYGVGYDFRSIMHYQGNFFAVDTRYDTLIPRDPRQTGLSLGGPEMTPMDVAKLRAAYRCHGTEPSGCGGSLTGDGGALDGSLALVGEGDEEDEGCEWLLTVEDGHRVEVEFQNFDVLCSEGSLVVYSGFKQLQDVFGSYCGRNHPPKKLTLPSNCATVEFRRKRGSDASFKAKWKKVSTECCETVKISLSWTSEAFPKLRTYLGIFRRVSWNNGSPLYRLQTNYLVWLSRTVPMSSFSQAAWAVGHDLDLAPNGNSVSSRRGPKYFLGGNTKCPRLQKGLFHKDEIKNKFELEEGVKITCMD